MRRIDKVRVKLADRLVADISVEEILTTSKDKRGLLDTNLEQLPADVRIALARQLVAGIGFVVSHEDDDSWMSERWVIGLPESDAVGPPITDLHDDPWHKGTPPWRP